MLDLTACEVCVCVCVYSILCERPCVCAVEIAGLKLTAEFTEHLCSVTDRVRVCLCARAE